MVDYSKWKAFDNVASDSDEETEKPASKTGGYPEVKAVDVQARQSRHRDQADVDNNYLKSAVYQAGRDMSKPLMTANCFNCMEPGAQLRCSRCRQVAFCSRKCQEESWKVHKFQCRQQAKTQREEREEAQQNTEALFRQAKAEKLAGGATPTQDFIDQELEKRVKSGAKLAPMRDPYITRVAIIVPFREQPLQDRKTHLRYFVKHMRDILEDLGKYGCIKEWKILIVQQSDDGEKFNRGALLNAGFEILEREQKEPYHTVIFHNIDLLPIWGNECIGWYAAEIPETFGLHLAAEGYEKHGGERKNPHYIGGILALRPEDFRNVDGYPTDCWGWAAYSEDNELLMKLQEKGIHIMPCPSGSFKDLDRINFYDPPEDLDLWRWCNDRFLEYQFSLDEEYAGAAGPAPVLRDGSGKVVQGPVPSEIEPPRYKGGLSSLKFKVIKSEVCEIHAQLVEVQLQK